MEENSMTYSNMFSDASVGERNFSRNYYTYGTSDALHALLVGVLAV